MPLAGSDDWGDKLQRPSHLQINQRPKPIAFPEPDVRTLARLLRKILRHLKLWEARERAPPPRLFAHKLDQLLASLSAEQARQVQLSTDSIF